MAPEDLFEILAREHATMLTAYLRGWSHDAATVEDLFQETLIVAWKSLEKYDKTRPFGPWLRGIANNLVLAHRRKIAHRDVTLDPNILVALDQRWEAVALRQGDTWDEKLDALKACWDQLPPQYQRPLQVRYHDDLAGQVLADHLGLSLENLKKRLQRGLKQLQQCIQRKLQIAESHP